MVPTEETRDRVLAKSTELFARLGLHRTTFTEIARAAGISRPTLYVLFPGKSRLCAAVIERFGRETTAAMIQRAEKKDALGARLRAALVFREPLLVESDGCFARELFASEDPAIVEALNRVSEGREKALVRIIRDSRVDLKPLRLTAPKLARLISCSMRGFLAYSDSEAMARELANGLVRLIERAVEDGSTTCGDVK